MLSSLRRALDSFCADEPNGINRLATAVDDFAQILLDAHASRRGAVIAGCAAIADHG